MQLFLQFIFCNKLFVDFILINLILCSFHAFCLKLSKFAISVNLEFVSGKPTLDLNLTTHDANFRGHFKFCISADTRKSIQSIHKYQARLLFVNDQ